jgi:hypothetical protein
VKRHAIGPGCEQEVTPVRDLQGAALASAEAENVLQFGRLPRALAAKERERRVGGHDGALVGRQEVARVLCREYQRSVVLADATREADHEPADRRVFEEQTELVDDEHAAAILALDPCPQRLGQEEVNRSDHLVAKLTHAEGDDWGLQIDVGGCAEHGAETACDPTVEDDRDSRGDWKAVGHVT